MSDQTGTKRGFPWRLEARHTRSGQWLEVSRYATWERALSAMDNPQIAPRGAFDRLRVRNARKESPREAHAD